MLTASALLARLACPLLVFLSGFLLEVVLLFETLALLVGVPVVVAVLDGLLLLALELLSREGVKAFQLLVRLLFLLLEVGDSVLVGLDGLLAGFLLTLDLVGEVLPALLIVYALDDRAFQPALCALLDGSLSLLHVGEHSGELLVGEFG